MSAITAFRLAADPFAWYGLLTWPQFSVTSYLMVSSLSRQGVKPTTLIDVGANVGQFAVAALKLLPTRTVYCFEPQPDCAAKLADNLKGWPGVTIYNIGLSDICGDQSFHVNSHRHSSSFLALSPGHREAFPEAVDVATTTIRISTLDAVLDTVEFSPPVLLKVDVQGYEGHVLRGAEETLRRVDYVILEASFRPMYEGELLFFGSREAPGQLWL